jgi:putative DNA primase/helicase
MNKELKPPVVPATNGSEIKSTTNKKEVTPMSNTTNKNGNQQPNSQTNSKKLELTPPIIKPLEGIFKDAALLKQLNRIPLTDAGNGECFAYLYKDFLRYCKSNKRWFTWDGFRWKVDTDGEANRAAIFTARARKAAATYIYNQDLKTKSERWAKDSESTGKRNAMLNTAIHLKSIEIQIDEFDRNPFLAGLKNGTLDLETGEFRESKREDYISMQFNVAYDQNAKAPRWEQFLEEVFAGDKELISWIHRAVGYLLTGNTSEQKIFLCFGKGANGKSVFLDVLTHLLGDYAGNCSFSTFDANKKNEATNDLAALKGKRLVTVIETNEDKRLDEARVKVVTGQDNVTARFLYGEFFSYKPSFKIFMAMNHKPLIRGMDEGIWRRIKLIPFTQNFIDKADPYLVSKLINELPGILNWAIQGLIEWKQKRLGSAKVIDEASDSYRKESDLLQQWIDETLTFNPDSKLSCQSAYESFLMWCIERSYPRWSVSSFGRAMTEKGFERKSDGKARHYIGISL